MHGVLTEEEKAYVKAAIVKFIKVKALTDEQEVGEEAALETETETVTYAKTDDEGNFVIQDLDPNERYRIEIYVKPKEVEKEAPEIREESLEEVAKPVDILDSLTSGQTRDTTIENISLKNLNKMSDLVKRPYLQKNNLW